MHKKVDFRGFKKEVSEENQNSKIIMGKEFLNLMKIQKNKELKNNSKSFFKKIIILKRKFLTPRNKATILSKQY